MKNRGFTIVELLTAISIFTILSSFGFANLGTARSKGRDTKRLADLKTIQTALELYTFQEKDDNGQHPDNYPYPIKVSGEPGIYGNQYFAKYIATPRNPDKKTYIYLAPSCLRPGAGTTSDPTIISPMKGPIKLLDQAIIAADPEGTYCPPGSGWLPYLIYTILERPNKQTNSLVPKDPNLAVFSVNQPLYPTNNRLPNAINGSYCVPALPNCPNGYY